MTTLARRLTELRDAYRSPDFSQSRSIERLADPLTVVLTLSRRERKACETFGTVASISCDRRRRKERSLPCGGPRMLTVVDVRQDNCAVG